MWFGAGFQPAVLGRYHSVYIYIAMDLEVESSWILMPLNYRTSICFRYLRMGSPILRHTSVVFVAQGPRNACQKRVMAHRALFEVKKPNAVSWRSGHQFPGAKCNQIEG